MAKASVSKLRRELSELEGAKNAKAFTDEAYSTTKDGRIHAGQLRLLRSTAQRVLVACTPRAGKTRGILRVLARTAIATPNVACLYVAITAIQAGRIAWRPWKRVLREFGIHCDHADGEFKTTFPNGSVVYFAGADDASQIAVFLGESFAGGVVVLDECQDRPDAVIVPLIEDVLEDRLSDITDEHPTPGRLICIGSLPRNTGGWFWRQLTDDASAFERHGWSRLDNPFLKDQQAQLQRYLASKNMSVDDEVVQRNWYGKPVWTKNGGRPYRYDSVRNDYNAERAPWADTVTARSGYVNAAVAWPGITHAFAAIDLGGADRASIQVVGFGRTVDVVQHLFDWTSERDQHHTWGELIEVLKHCRQHYPVCRWVYDSDASKTEHDTLGREYGIPFIAAANKTEMAAQVRRLSDLLQRGKVKVISGSETAKDFARAQWDQRELSKGRWKLAIGPAKVDASEAFRYAIGEWHDVFVAAPAALTPTEAEERREELELGRLSHRPRARPGDSDELERVCGRLPSPLSDDWR